MLQRFYAQLPEFARPGHPVMRYLLLREGRRTTRISQLLRLVLGLALIILLLLIGWLIATEFGRIPFTTSNPLDSIFLVCYWPLVVIQFFARLLALNATVGVIAAEERSGTWDTLKITTDGALLTMKARWATAFYRLWLLLLLLTAVRVVFTIVFLINLSAFQGRRIDLLLTGTTPLGQMPVSSGEVSIVFGILIIAVMMTGAFLAPFTAVALDASLGMLIGTIARGKTQGMLGTLAIVLVRFLFTVYVLWLGAQALSFSPAFLAVLAPSEPQPVLTWISAFLGIGEGDLGLTLLYTDHVQRLWADIDYGVFIGVAFLGYVLLQAALANFFIRLAGRRAARADRL